MPQLTGLVLDGGSRHQLSKGFLLRSAAGVERSWGYTQDLLRTANRSLRQERELERFQIAGMEKHPGVIMLMTPFLPVFTFAHREEFCRLLCKAISILNDAVKPSHHILGIGLEPIAADHAGSPPDLCPDLHQIEILDEDEMERVYNLFRQYLPELIAITTNSALRNGRIQGDFSQRMRLNPSSFLPRYLSQFTTSRLDQIQRMMRKDHGLGDLRQLDVNPLGEKISLLELEDRVLLSDSVPAIELRFSDAQCSIPFLRALIILFQVIAIQGRAMTRQGRRVPYMSSDVIDANKARAIQRGMTAIFQPDRESSEDLPVRYWYHERSASEFFTERASSSLLHLLERTLLPFLRNLECLESELLPLVLGLELRRRNRQSLANYAEYQQFLAHTHARNLTHVLLEQWQCLLKDPARDLASEKNREAYPGLCSEIEQTWRAKLTHSNSLPVQQRVAEDRSSRGGEHGN